MIIRDIDKENFMSYKNACPYHGSCNYRSEKCAHSLPDDECRIYRYMADRYLTIKKEKKNIYFSEIHDEYAKMAAISSIKKGEYDAAITEIQLIKMLKKTNKKEAITE